MTQKPNIPQNDSKINDFSLRKIFFLNLCEDGIFNLQCDFT